MSRPSSVDVAPLIAAYYRKPDNAAGGGCHVVLDDGNIEDSSVFFCGLWCAQHRDADGLELMRLFSLMKMTARRKAIAIAHRAAQPIGNVRAFVNL